MAKTVGKPSDRNKDLGRLPPVSEPRKTGNSAARIKIQLVGHPYEVRKSILFRTKVGDSLPSIKNVFTYGDNIDVEGTSDPLGSREYDSMNSLGESGIRCCLVGTGRNIDLHGKDGWHLEESQGILKIKGQERRRVGASRRACRMTLEAAAPNLEIILPRSAYNRAQAQQYAATKAVKPHTTSHRPLWRWQNGEYEPRILGSSICPTG